MNTKGLLFIKLKANHEYKRGLSMKIKAKNKQERQQSE